MAERIEQARAEIARRRLLAEAAHRTSMPWWHARVLTDVATNLTVMASTAAADGAFIAANGPQHALAVLAAADQVLDRHAQHSDAGIADGAWCAHDGGDYPCPDLTTLLDLYAPDDVTSDLTGAPA